MDTGYNESKRELEGRGPSQSKTLELKTPERGEV